MRIICFLLFILIQILLCMSKKIIEINNESFNRLVESNKYDNNKKIFVIFYTNNCNPCMEALSVINNNILNEYKYDNKIDFCKVNCDLKENIWLNIRFNITRIPYIILINGNYFYELNSNYDKYELNSFINDKKDKSELIKIPKDISLIKKRIIVINHTINYINHYFKSHYYIEININIIIFVFILFFILLLILFLWLLKYILVYCCCNLCLGKICKKKKENREIIEITRVENMTKINSDVSESELESNAGDNSLDISNISDSIFKKEIDEITTTTIKKVYKKEKIE